MSLHNPPLPLLLLLLLLPPPNVRIGLDYARKRRRTLQMSGAEFGVKRAEQCSTKRPSKN